MSDSEATQIELDIESTIHELELGAAGGVARESMRLELNAQAMLLLGMTPISMHYLPSSESIILPLPYSGTFFGVQFVRFTDPNVWLSKDPRWRLTHKAANP